MDDRTVRCDYAGGEEQKVEAVRVRGLKIRG